MIKHYWAIKHFKHDWFFDVTTRRADSIKKFIGDGIPYGWKHMYRHGYRAVKVMIVEI